MGGDKKCDLENVPPHMGGDKILTDHMPKKSPLKKRPPPYTKNNMGENFGTSPPIWGGTLENPKSSPPNDFPTADFFCTLEKNLAGIC